MVAPQIIQNFLLSVTLALTKFPVLTGRHHEPPMQKSSEENNNDRIAMKEEIFLSQLLTSMNLSPETARGKGDTLGNLRNFISQFSEVPHIFKRDEASLQINLRASGINLQSFNELYLWVPKSWFTEETRINEKRNILHKTFVRENDGFLGFSVTKLAKRTLRKRKALIISGLNKEYSLQYAFLDVKENKQESSDKVRLRRSGSGSCGLHTVMVNLTDIGWDFVVSPSVLEYRYCGGQCSHTDIPARMFVKSHGQIRYKLQQRGSLSLPPACCSPSRYEGLTMLYMDGLDEAGRQVIRRGEFQDTLASQCGCG